MRGLAHITSGGLGNLLRLAAEVGYEIDDPLPVPPDLRADPGARRRLRRGDARGLQHGLRLLRRSSPPGDEEAALELLRAHYPAAKRVGRAVAGRGRDPARLSGTPRRRAESLDGPSATAIPSAKWMPDPQAR